MKKRLLSLGFVGVFVLALCCGMAAAAEPRASKTLLMYLVSALEGDSTGEIKIAYDVRANKIADKVGVSYIEIYRSDGTRVATIAGTIDNGLVRTDSHRHCSTYVYKCTPGVSYYAVVTVFAAIGADYDSRDVTTSSVTAP